MNQTVEWICFVIGGILILTAVLTSIFKINLGGASVEGQSHWTQKIVAFFAGWVFVIIGAVFHGVAMSNSSAGPSTQTSQQQTSQLNAPTSQLSTTSSDSSDRTSPSPTRTNEQPRETDISGVWQNAAGFFLQISQTGNAIKADLVSADEEQVGGGNGSVNDGNVTLNITVFGIPHNCDLRLSSDARQMSGSCGSNATGVSSAAYYVKVR